jgi:putative ABC transport system substrate-binding protein
MRRREFITLLAGAAMPWPMTVLAGSPDQFKRIGVLLNNVETEPQQKLNVASFEQALRTVGWKVGQNISIEYRWSRLIPERTTALGAELAGLNPDVIVTHTTAALVAVRNATKTIPIVFTAVTDPVAQGFVTSVAQPGGNITGFVAFEFSIGSKWIGLLKQLVPDLAHVAMMFNPTTSPQSAIFLKSLQAAAPTLGVDVTPLAIHEEKEIEPAIVGFTRQSNGGLVIAGDNFLARSAKIVVEAAAKYRLPAVYANDEFILAGGLMGYTFDSAEEFRGAAYYADRILKGSRPGDLPVQFPTKFRLVISLKAAKALGLEVPMSMMLTADEVID